MERVLEVQKDIHVNDVHLCFIKYPKAFDRVRHDELIEYTKAFDKSMMYEIITQVTQLKIHVDGKGLQVLGTDSSSES